MRRRQLLHPVLSARFEMRRAGIILLYTPCVVPSPQRQKIEGINPVTELWFLKSGVWGWGVKKNPQFPQGVQSSDDFFLPRLLPVYEQAVHSPPFNLHRILLYFSRSSYIPGILQFKKVFFFVIVMQMQSDALLDACCAALCLHPKANNSLAWSKHNAVLKAYRKSPNSTAI